MLTFSIPIFVILPNGDAASIVLEGSVEQVVDSRTGKPCEPDTIDDLFAIELTIATLRMSLKQRQPNPTPLPVCDFAHHYAPRTRAATNQEGQIAR